MQTSLLKIKVTGVARSAVPGMSESVREKRNKTSTSRRRTYKRRGPGGGKRYQNRLVHREEATDRGAPGEGGKEGGDKKYYPHRSGSEPSDTLPL